MEKNDEELSEELAADVDKVLEKLENIPEYTLHEEQINQIKKGLVEEHKDVSIEELDELTEQTRRIELMKYDLMLMPSTPELEAELKDQTRNITSMKYDLIFIKKIPKLAIGTLVNLVRQNATIEYYATIDIALS